MMNRRQRMRIYSKKKLEKKILCVCLVANRLVFKTNQLQTLFLSWAILSHMCLDEAWILISFSIVFAPCSSSFLSRTIFIFSTYSNRNISVNNPSIVVSLSDSIHRLPWSSNRRANASFSECLSQWGTYRNCICCIWNQFTAHFQLHYDAVWTRTRLRFWKRTRQSK